HAARIPLDLAGARPLLVADDVGRGLAELAQDRGHAADVGVVLLRRPPLGAVVLGLDAGGQPVRIVRREAWVAAHARLPGDPGTAHGEHAVAGQVELGAQAERRMVGDVAGVVRAGRVTGVVGDHTPDRTEVSVTAVAPARELHHAQA